MRFCEAHVSLEIGSKIRSGHSGGQCQGHAKNIPVQDLSQPPAAGGLPKVANLHRLVNLHGRLHNHCIALHKRFYGLFGKHLNQFALMKHITKLKTIEGFEWLGLMDAQAIQDSIQRIEKGYALFFSEREKGNKKIRPPSFRKINKARSFTLKQTGWKLVQDNIIRVDGRTYKFALSRPIEGTVKTVTIKRDAVGDFWVA